MRRVVRSVGTQLTDRQRVKDRRERERERETVENLVMLFSNATSIECMSFSYRINRTSKRTTTMRGVNSSQSLVN